MTSAPLENDESRVSSGSNQTDGDLEGQEVEEILIKQEQQQGWANANGLSNISWNGTNNGRPNGYHINRNGFSMNHAMPHFIAYE